MARIRELLSQAETQPVACVAMVVRYEDGSIGTAYAGDLTYSDIGAVEVLSDRLRRDWWDE